ncbi:hypothetical protein CF327_g7504 [Tilletia walkeri]|nr:hypothetical protein CF327_g7504 [Tilletia walkeri]
MHGRVTYHRPPSATVNPTLPLFSANINIISSSSQITVAVITLSIQPDTQQSSSAPAGLGRLVSPNPRPHKSQRLSIGPVTQQTAEDAEHARAQTVFHLLAIEAIIRDGRIDNGTRREAIGAMRADPVFNNYEEARSYDTGNRSSRLPTLPFVAYLT